MQLQLFKPGPLKQKVVQYRWPILAGVVGLFLWLNRKTVEGMAKTVQGFVDAWKPYPITVFSSVGARSAEAARRVIAALQVATNSRYTPRDGTTFCNIFVWDYSRAMGCEIPHWVGPNGISVPVGMGSELSANGVARWLVAHGGREGWQRVTELTARARAAQGYPTIVTWDNVGGIGHQAALYPAGYAATMIAQAGANNFEQGALSKGFGNRKEPLLQFWTHE